ncbi:hypothetical protein A4A49_27463 [Nicotiana attenuata]|uniref:Uncharacterized protein n=1 Tax=Nicotiana attenuata TaxID=49451 RepID=A0A1J6KQ61_NICAT|nr:hypothetical protein A4A49_27463 [Nicotiana attenuata]
MLFGCFLSQQIDNLGLNNEEEIFKQEGGYFKRPTDEVITRRRIVKFIAIKRHQLQPLLHLTLLTGIHSVPPTGTISL